MISEETIATICDEVTLASLIESFWSCPNDDKKLRKALMRVIKYYSTYSQWMEFKNELE